MYLLLSIGDMTVAHTMTEGHMKPRLDAHMKIYGRHQNLANIFAVSVSQLTRKLLQV